MMQEIMGTDGAGASGGDVKAGRAPLVRFERVTKRYGGVTAVNELSLDIGAGEFFALLGPSGCGKSTLLRMLAGFETPDEGRILLDGEDIVGMPPHLRPVNMMFQSYALFPHLTVAGNIAFGLRQEHLPKTEIDQRVAAMLSLVQLDKLGDRRPHQLSGGQRQRVALARALVKRPKVFLLDEPLAALDKKLRTETQFELMALQEKLGLSFVIVTHDQEEAMTMADRIGVMNHGRLAQVGTAAEIYEQPATRWVAEFIGDVNLLEGTVSETGGEAVTVTTNAGLLRTTSAAPLKTGDNVAVAIRPEKFRISTEKPEAQPNCLAGEVLDIGYLGDMSLYKVKLDTGAIVKAASVNMTRLLHRPIGWNERVFLSVSPDAAVVLKE
jgi:putrescine transport system ATP-binding protein